MGAGALLRRGLGLRRAAQTIWAIAGDRRVVEWHGWAFVNVGGDAPAFEEHVGNLEAS